MSDPFSENRSQHQLVREAQMGLSLVVVVVAAVGTWTFYQYQSFKNNIPKHVQNAPVATHVGPDVYLSQLEARSLRSQESALANRDASDQKRGQPQQLFQSRSKPGPIQPEKIVEPIEELVVEIVPPKSTYSKNKTVSVPVPRQSEPFTPPTQSENHFEPAAEDITNQLAESKAEKTFVNPIKSFFPGSNHKIESSKPKQETIPPRKDDEFLKHANSIVARLPLQPSIQESSNNKNEVVQAEFVESEGPLKPTVANNDFAANKVVAAPKKAELDNDFLVAAKVANDESIPQIAETVEDKPALQETDPAIYETQSGESFFTIAQKKYGDGRYFRALFELNRSNVDGFDKIAAGTKLRTPDVETLHQRFPDLCPQELLAKANPKNPLIYTTLAGDTLFDIARRKMGQASRYLELMALNKKILPANANHLTRLPADLDLKLPN